MSAIEAAKDAVGADDAGEGVDWASEGVGGGGGGLEADADVFDWAWKIGGCRR